MKKSKAKSSNFLESNDQTPDDDPWRGWLRLNDAPWSVVAESDDRDEVVSKLEAIRAVLNDGVVRISITRASDSPRCPATTSAMVGSVAITRDLSNEVIDLAKKARALPVELAREVLGYTEVAMRHLSTVAEVLRQYQQPAETRTIRVDLRDLPKTAGEGS